MDRGWEESDIDVNQLHLGLSRKAIHSAVDASLARLNTSYIDLFQIHRFDYETPIEETMCALHDLVKDGKVRYVSPLSREHCFLSYCNRFFEIILASFEILLT